MTWQFTLTGLGLGLIVGLTGVGGGSLMTPILIIVFGFKPSYAVGTDIFHGAIFKSFGAVRHRRLGTVHSHLALWLFAGSGPLAIAGVVVSYVLRNSIANAETVLGYAIGVALIGGGAGFLAKSFVKRGIQPSEAPFIMSRRDKLIALGTGAVFGFIVGITSVGSGTYFGLMMVLVYPLTMPRIVGTDIFHAAALLWVAGHRPSHHRRRRPSRDRVAAPRLGAGDPDLEPVHGEGPGHDDSLRSRWDPDHQRDQAPQHARGELDPRRRPHHSSHRSHDLHRERDGERVPRQGRGARNGRVARNGRARGARAPSLGVP